MRNGLFVTFAAALSLASVASAVRVCGTNSSSTYQWTVGDARYDGADPSDPDGTSTVAISIIPGTGTGYAAFFECVGEWPGTWDGWYEGGSDIVWSDCIWAGNGPTFDNTVSFALDWKNRTMYVSHTFNCSDKEGSDALAVGSVKLDALDCTAAEEGSAVCMLPAGTQPTLTTKGGPAHLESGASCPARSETYQSWQLEQWVREYGLPPGSTTPGSDTGPSFTLKNMANSDVFNCAPLAHENGTFAGNCEWAGAGNATDATTATFTFDPQLDMLIITQIWVCSGSPSYDAVGVGFVQATCDRNGDLLTCTSGPVWIGTETV